LFKSINNATANRFIKNSRKKLDKLFNYLENHWSEEVKLRFISKLEQRIQIVRQKPEAFPKSKIKEGLHKCVITRQTSVYFKFDEKAVYILTVFDNRQDADKLAEETK